MAPHKDRLEKEVEDIIQRLWNAGTFVGTIAVEVIAKVREHDKQFKGGNDAQ